ncbi:hypothetical protein BJ878DRAFT_542598 [Calycina marina]|uniref:Uncharacterized protein n=1 Tax=Calycina marina TaxID=1763456 RepID=A0A9P7Z1Z8_9HELO|nr:hypothetical protein BJ878DRAFT_542598 [Calycina marina]
MLFVSPSPEGEYKAVKDVETKYQYGHVVAEEFPCGEIKNWLDRVLGMLVEMPLSFMEEVDFASDISLNVFTEEIYT